MEPSGRGGWLELGRHKTIDFTCFECFALICVREIRRSDRVTGREITWQEELLRRAHHRRRCVGITGRHVVR